MPEILHELTIAASPDKVFKALTEGEGIAMWWTLHAVAEPKVGSMVNVRFGNSPDVHKFEVIDLEPEHKVEWVTLDSLPEWKDTHIAWELSPVENGTKIMFEHRGWASSDGMLPFCSYRWAVHLKDLKDILEKGEG